MLRSLPRSTWPALDMATLKRDALYGRLSKRHGEGVSLAPVDVVAAPGSTGITLLPEDPSARCKRWREEGAAWTAPIERTQKLIDAFKVSMAVGCAGGLCVHTWLWLWLYVPRSCAGRPLGVAVRGVHACIAVRRPYLSYSDPVSSTIPELWIRKTILGCMH